ncbi:MAG: ThiF family adenylyltransferase [Ignavibacteriae bacterium]|nr:ThiF family adenylyltransferase [Ignavibacteriota bacterium]
MIDISSDINNRYSRFRLISWWDQSVLKNAKVLVIGCGALGNEIVKNLSMLGIGSIYVVDMDNVEKSNLTRSVLFRKEDEGKSKAETVCKRAKELNDEISIKYFNGNVFGLGLGVFREMDIVICGLDNREARLFVNQSCWKVNRPWVDGAIETLNGVARMFIPPEGICYECTMNETDYKLMNKRKSCLLLGLEDIQQGKIPTTPTVSSVIAGLQVQEAVKYLHKKDFELLSGKGFVFSGMTNESYIVEYQKNENCPSHYTFEHIIDSGINFQDAVISDILRKGKEVFSGDKFEIEFNNEVVYEMTDEKNNSIEFFANMNLLTQKDIRRGDILYKINSFHKLESESSVSKKSLNLKLTELKIPYNDIITLRKGNNEVHIAFNNMEIFI